MCVFGNRADGVWLGSSEQFASSILNIVYTQRNIHIHLLHSEAHNQTERKTNRGHVFVNTWVTSDYWMTVKSSPFLSPSLVPFLFKSTFSPQPCYPCSLSFLEIIFYTFYLPDDSTIPPSFFLTTRIPPLISLSPSFFFLPPVRLLLCLMAFYSYVMVDGFM